MNWMSPCRKSTSGRPGRVNFALLAGEVLSLNPAIRWVALEEAGRDPRWAWHDEATGELYTGAAYEDVQLVDPLLFLVAEGPASLGGGRENSGPHRLLFITLAYDDVVQVVARSGWDAYLSVALPPGAEGNAIGNALIALLQRHRQDPLVA